VIAARRSASWTRCRTCAIGCDYVVAATAIRDHARRRLTLLLKTARSKWVFVFKHSVLPQQPQSWYHHVWANMRNINTIPILSATGCTGSCRVASWKRSVSSQACALPTSVLGTGTSASLDGGVTFAPAVRVATDLSCPDPSRAGEYPVRRWSTGGDYFGFAAGADGRFHVLWPDARDGTFEIWTAAASVRAGTPR
jgi:hypothetical protein